MQNENTPRPSTGVDASRYGGAGSFGCPAARAVLDAIDQRLRVLDAHAERERLRPRAARRRSASSREHVARRVAGREHHARAPISSPPSASRTPRRARPVARDEPGRRARRSGSSTPTRCEPLAQRGDHLGQLVRADVRARIDQDRRPARRAARGSRSRRARRRACARACRACRRCTCRRRPRRSSSCCRDRRAPCWCSPLRSRRRGCTGLPRSTRSQRDARARQLVRAEQPRRSVADDHHARAARPRARAAPPSGGVGCARRAEQQVKAHATAARVDRALAQLERRQLRLGHVAAARATRARSGASSSGSSSPSSIVTSSGSCGRASRVRSST